MKMFKSIINYIKKRKVYLLFFLILFVHFVLFYKKIQNEVIDERVVEKQFYVKTSRANDNINDLVSKIYLDEELELINSYQLTYYELNDLYPVECVRYIDNIEYSVAYKGENKYLIITFNKKGEKKASKIYNSRYEKESYSFIEFGEKFSNIKEFDSNGYYFFWNSSNIEAEYKSWHYTTDGYVIIITYDEYLEVVGIEERLI